MNEWMKWNEMNEWKCSDLKCVRKPLGASLVWHTMQTNLTVEQSKIVRWSESPWNQSGRKGKGLWRKGFAEEPSISAHPLISKYFQRVAGLITVEKQTGDRLSQQLELGRTLQATRCGQSFPKPSGGDILRSRVTTSRCLIRPLANIRNNTQYTPTHRLCAKCYGFCGDWEIMGEAWGEIAFPVRRCC